MSLRNRAAVVPGRRCPQPFRPLTRRQEYQSTFLTDVRKVPFTTRPRNPKPMSILRCRGSLNDVEVGHHGHVLVFEVVAVHHVAAAEAVEVGEHFDAYGRTSTVSFQPPSLG
jgi:hypothetical protein